MTLSPNVTKPFLPGLAEKAISIELIKNATTWLACLGLFLLVPGCRGNDGRVATYPVVGKVTVQGEVPIGALVVLYPAQTSGTTEIRPSAQVQPDGTFRVTTFDSEDGAPAGAYRATLQWHKLVKKGSDYAAGPDVVPRAYSRPESTPWKITVRDSGNELPPLVIQR